MVQPNTPATGANNPNIKWVFDSDGALVNPSFCNLVTLLLENIQLIDECPLVAVPYVRWELSKRFGYEASDADIATAIKVIKVAHLEGDHQ